MIYTSSNSGHTAYGVKEYILDDAADLENLPVDNSQSPGSTAFVIETSEVYMFNNRHEWKKI